MIVRKFLAWTATAPAAARAEGAAALARAYLDDELDPGDRRDAEAVMTALLDDESPLVRTALAKVLGPSRATPHHLVTALAADRSDIATLVLAASPLLGEEELIDAVALGDVVAQCAVARRPGLSAGVAGAIAEVGTLPACQVLCLNDRATIAPLSLRRLLQRFGGDATLRDLLGRRPELDPGLRHDLAAATAEALARFVTGCGWMSADRAGRVVREATDEAAVSLAADTIRTDDALRLRDFVAHLSEAGRLTPALLLRAILCGELALFEAGVSLLSGVPVARVAGLVRGASGPGFAALYARAGLPQNLLTVFEVAAREAGRAGASEVPGPRRQVIGRVLAACGPLERSGELGKVGALLRTLDAQAARAEARFFAAHLARERAVPALPSPSPQDRSRPLRSAA